MKKLFLLRHAQTEGFSFSVPDKERKLTETGVQDAMRLGKILKEENTQIDKIACSVATRTQMTARLVANRVDYPPSQIQIENGLYQCSDRDLLAFLNQLDDKIGNLFLINHNPAVSSFIYLLTGKDYGFVSPCTLVVFGFETKNWSEIRQGTGKLEQIRTPERSFEPQPL